MRNLTLSTQFLGFFLPWVVRSGIGHVGTRRSLTDHITLPASASLSCFRCHGERKKGPSSAVILISLPEVSASLTDSERNASAHGFLTGSLQGQICVYVCARVCVWEWGKERDWIRGTDPTQTRCLGLKHVITRRLAQLCDVAFRRTAPRP